MPYAARRQKVFELMPNHSAMVLHANTKTRRSGDAEYPFRQNSNFYYLSGFTEDEATLILLKADKQCDFILFCKETTELEGRWQGPRLGTQGAIAVLGADQAYLHSELQTKMPEMLANYQQVDAKTILPELRVIKNPDEIELMRKAAQISAGAHVRAMKACKAGLYEYQLEAEYLHEFTYQGARSPAYTSIVGAGANACILHYIDNQAILKSGDLVLVDAGAEYQYYAADITRVFPVNGRFSEAQKTIYELVLKAQLAGIEQVRANKPWDSMQNTVVKIIVEGLVELGILQGDVNQLIAQQAYKKYYMHNSGHWLGLDVHDVGEYKINNTWRSLKPGMVLTVEPGLYFSLDCQEIDEKWRGIGVRIEDDVLVTEQDPDVLSKDVPKTIEAIETLMQQ